MMRAAAVILAAGSGSRLGGVAKALIRIDGVPLVRRLIAAVRGAGIDDVLVITGPYHDAIAQAVASTQVPLVRNTETARGQGWSVRLGLQHTTAQAEAVMVLLCDQPLLTSADLVVLREAFESRAYGEFLVPRVQAQGRGNPVVVSRRAVQAILHSDRYVACRDFMDAHPQSVSYLDTCNDHFVVDIDSAQDLATVGDRLSCTVQLPDRPFSP